MIEQLLPIIFTVLAFAITVYLSVNILRTNRARRHLTQGSNTSGAKKLRRKTVCTRTLERSHAHHSERRAPANLSADDIPVSRIHSALANSGGRESYDSVPQCRLDLQPAHDRPARNQRVHLHVSQPRFPCRAFWSALRLRELTKPPAGVFSGVDSPFSSSITSLIMHNSNCTHSSRKFDCHIGVCICVYTYL